jgi:hypothetical protein
VKNAVHVAPKKQYLSGRIQRLVFDLGHREYSQ